MTGLVVFLAASVLVSVSATAAVSLLVLRSALDVMLAWAVIASSIVVVTLLLAGAALDELAVWVVLTLNGIIAAALAGAALAAGHRPRLPVAASHGSLRALLDEARRDVWVSILVAAAVVEVVWRLVISYLMPPYANDALWYHLTTVAGWLQDGRIGASELSIWSTVYPYNGELLFMWPALLIGNDTFVDAVQLPFAIVGAIAVAGIGRTVGLSRRGAIAAGSLFLLAPVVLSQTTANYTDLIFTALFLTAMHFLLRFLVALDADTGRGNRAHLFLAGLAGGLALGTKSLGVVYVGLLALLLAGHLVAALARGRASPSSAAWLLILFALPVLALGSYHYAEIWMRFGSPFYPVRIAAFGVEFFDGRSLDWFLTPPISPGPWWREIWGQWRTDYFFFVEPRFHAYSYDDRTSGLGPLWSYLGLPLLLVFALHLYRSNRAMLLNLLLPVTVMFAVQPYRWWSRFTMILIAVGVIAIVAVVEELPRRWAPPLKAFVLLLAALGAFFPTVKIDGEFWATRILNLTRVSPDERTIGGFALPGYRWVDQIPADATIGVDTSADFLGGQPYILAYPLFGPRFEHDVYPLPQTALNAFKRAVVQKQIHYVFVQRGRRLDYWSTLAQREGCAQRIYDGPVYAGQFGRVYRIVPHCVSAPQTSTAETVASSVEVSRPAAKSYRRACVWVRARPGSALPRSTATILSALSRERPLSARRSRRAAVLSASSSASLISSGPRRATPGWGGTPSDPGLKPGLLLFS